MLCINVEPCYNLHDNKNLRNGDPNSPCWGTINSFYCQNKTRSEVIILARKCNPSPKVRNAGRTLAKSKSSSSKSKAGKTLVAHKNRVH